MFSAVSVFQIDFITFKLSCSSKCEWGKKNAVATNTTENAVFNWMAPEVMFSMPPSFYCDMFGFCAVLWEIFHGKSHSIFLFAQITCYNVSWNTRIMPL